MSDNPDRYTLCKAERISGKKAVGTLLSGACFSSEGPLRYAVLKDNGLAFNRILVSVPKKHFKRAVHRNRIKRLLRESYRLQKHVLSPDESSGGSDIMFIYSSREMPSCEDIHRLVGNVLQKLCQQRQTR